MAYGLCQFSELPDVSQDAVGSKASANYARELWSRTVFSPSSGLGQVAQ